MPRVPEPWKSNIFYYDQYDLLLGALQGLQLNLLRVPPGRHRGLRAGAKRHEHGPRDRLPPDSLPGGVWPWSHCLVPGKPHGYRSTHSDTFQDILSRMEIFAALHRDACPNGSEFNVADGEAVTWERVWPGICSYFGSVGGPPREGQMTIMEDFVSRHRETWDRVAETHWLRNGVVERQNWGHTQFMLVDFDFDRKYSLEKTRSVGFTESIDTVKGYKVTFDRMVQAGLIPSFQS